MGIFDRWKKQREDSARSMGVSAKAINSNMSENKSGDYSSQWTEEEKHISFIVPRDVENKEVSGRELLSYGDCLAVIVRRDDRYHLLVDMMRLMQGIDNATLTGTSTPKTVPLAIRV